MKGTNNHIEAPTADLDEIEPCSYESEEEDNIENNHLILVSSKNEQEMEGQISPVVDKHKGL